MSERDRREMTFWEHLEELRWRLVRMIMYVAVGAAACWVFREQLLTLLRYPAEAGARMAGIEDFSFRIFEAAGGIILMMQISLVGGLIIASVGIIMELWLFVERRSAHRSASRCALATVRYPAASSSAT